LCFPKTAAFLSVGTATCRCGGPGCRPKKSSARDSRARPSRESIEYYVFQLSMFAAKKPIASVSLDISDLESKDGKPISAAAVYCLNLQGRDWLGRSLTREFSVGLGRARPLWLGVHAPSDARGTYRGVVRVRPKGLPETDVPVELSVAGEILAHERRHSGLPRPRAVFRPGGSARSHSQQGLRNPCRAHCVSRPKRWQVARLAGRRASHPPEKRRGIRTSDGRVGRWPGHAAQKPHGIRWLHPIHGPPPGHPPNLPPALSWRHPPRAYARGSPARRSPATPKVKPGNARQFIYVCGHGQSAPWPRLTDPRRDQSVNDAHAPCSRCPVG